MYITTRKLNVETLASIARAVSRDAYGGNLAVDVEHIGGNRYRVKIGARDSHGPGTRTSWSGRHGPYACWHAFRDVLAAWLTSDPDATVRTMLATYRGAAGFLADYPPTGDANIGSLFAPAYMPDLCACEGDDGPYVERLEYVAREIQAA